MRRTNISESEHKPGLVAVAAVDSTENNHNLVDCDI
jgi:hypothetical protein